MSVYMKIPYYVIRLYINCETSLHKVNAGADLNIIFTKYSYRILYWLPEYEWKSYFVTIDAGCHICTYVCQRITDIYPR